MAARTSHRQSFCRPFQLRVLHLPEPLAIDPPRLDAGELQRPELLQPLGRQGGDRALARVEVHRE